DYPRYEHAPKFQLMIATVPRSGSTAFCNDLWNTGVLGAPMEYLNFRWIERHGRWGAPIGDVREYWRQRRGVRTSPNGVFSYKMLVPNYFALRKRCPSLLTWLAPTHVVVLTRNDLLAQAVSYAKAIGSQQWFNYGRRIRELRYDRVLIENARKLIVEQRAQW